MTVRISMMNGGTRLFARLKPFKLTALALIAPELPHCRRGAAARADGVGGVVESLSLGLLDGLAIPADGFLGH